MFENALACHVSDFSFSVYQSFTLRAYCFVPFFWSGYPGLVSGQHASKNKVFVKKVLFSWRSCGQLVKHWTVMPEAFHSRPAGLNIYFFISTSLFHAWKFWMYTMFRSCFKLFDFFAHIIFSICHCSMGILSLEVNSR